MVLNACAPVVRMHHFFENVNPHILAYKDTSFVLTNEVKTILNHGSMIKMSIRTCAGAAGAYGKIA